MQWDLFISHASEDKDDVAEPLTTLFENQGLKVWFDKSTLTVGDSLRRSIDHGLANCRFGLVILSPHFFEKEWTKKELDGLVASEDGSEKKILPVWHNVTRKQVAAFSLTLADKLGVSTSKGLDHVATEIMRAFGREIPKTSSRPKKAASPRTGAKSQTRISTTANGTWILLGDHFFLAQSVRNHSNDKFEIVVAPRTGDEEAELAALRPNGYGTKHTVPFAANKDACVVRVEHVSTETEDGIHSYMLTLTDTGSGVSNPLGEMSINGIDADEIARRRATWILLDGPPAIDRRALSNDSFLNGTIQGSGEHAVKECSVRSIFKKYGRSPDWKEFARLKCTFLLKATGTVQHVLEFEIGSVRNQKVAVSFRGRRAKPYSNVDAVTIEVKGTCSLSD
jgi:hypothetical protein